MALACGTQLGPYEIVASLGRGGMGEVYRAKDARLGRDVAIKILAEKLASNPDALRRLEREARTLAALSHPNIVTIHDVSGADQETPYVVMELLQGETLRERMNRSVLSWRDALSIAVPIADGLAVAHSKGVIHRDLKPENIFITSDGVVKILDFGLARFHPLLSPNEVSVAATRTKETDDGILRGTLPYISPEQLRGQAVEASSDIFSFGCLFYEMIAGKRPFDSNTPVETLAAILNEAPEKLTELGQQIPLELESLIEHCLEKDPVFRFQSIRDVALDLKSISARSSAPITAALKRPSRRVLHRAVLAGIVLLVVVLYLTQSKRPPAVQDGIPQIQSIAVLPLRNLSADPKQQYFADGMTEELIANLARIESLRVISRTSVMEYKDLRKPLPEVAKELNVDSIIEGSVLHAGDRMRITVQLIHAPTDRHLWAKSYERDLSNILALQNEVAADITHEIKVNLTPTERGRLTRASKIHPDAYEAYLKGLELMKTPDLSGPDVRKAVEMFERAVNLDESFAVAYTELARAHALMYHFQTDHTPERLAKAKVAVDRAFQIQPGLPEAHLALGQFYYVNRDFPRAIKEYEIAEKDLPGNPTLLEVLAATRRRLSDFEGAFKLFKRVHELSPRDSRIAWETGLTCTAMRKYAEAIQYYDRAIAILPEETGYQAYKARNFLFWGDFRSARTTLERIRNQNDPEVLELWWYLEFYERNFEAALHRARLSPGLAKIRNLRMRHVFFEGMVYRSTSKQALARESFDKIWTDLKKDPLIGENGQLTAFHHAALGLGYAGVGRKEEAIREGKLAIQLSPVSEDAIRGPVYIWFLIHIYTLVGEYEEALRLIDYLLSIPAGQGFSVAVLRTYPAFDSLRDYPEYQRILQKYEGSDFVRKE